MREIVFDKYYFEDSSGFSYEKKQVHGNSYYVPMDYCMIESKPIKNDIQNDTIQEHARIAEPCGSTGSDDHSGSIRPQISVSDRALGRVKIFDLKSTDGTGALHKYQRNHRRSSPHSVLRTPSSNVLHGIRPKSSTNVVKKIS